MKAPFTVAFANLLLPGLGYVILQKRVVFGWLMLATSIASWVANLIFDTGAPLTKEETIFVIIGWITMAAFAIDGYLLAKESIGSGERHKLPKVQ